MSLNRVYQDISASVSKLKLFSQGDPFFSKNGYETAFANTVNYSKVNKEGDRRYWDCIDSTKQLKIELKKGRSDSFWLDLIRYYEILLASNGKYDDILSYPEQARASTTTAFICTKCNKSGYRITNIYLVNSKDLLSILKKARDQNYTDKELLEEAEKMVKWYNDLSKEGNNINMQFRLKVKDIEKMPSVKKIVF